MHANKGGEMSTFWRTMISGLLLVGLLGWAGPADAQFGKLKDKAKKKVEKKVDEEVDEAIDDALEGKSEEEQAEEAESAETESGESDSEAVTASAAEKL
ncbi:MAG: hypothetical protein JSV03_02980, partial [Planctomycetota bacterium]